MEQMDVDAIERAVRAAMAAEHEHECPAERRRIAWRRRMLFVGALVGGAYLLGDLAHFEAMHEGMRLGLDGLFACAIDKFCFGIAEAA